MADHAGRGAARAGSAHALAATPGLGRLPGDVHVRRKRGSFYFPFASVVLGSPLLSLIVWLLGR